MNLNVREIMDAYLVDIDFGFVERKDEKKTLVYTKASINNSSEKNAGYSIFSEGVGIFSSELGSELSKDRYANEIKLSAVSQGINQLRAYVALATSFYPFGKYQIPYIDLNHLVKGKGSTVGLPKGK